MNSCKMYAICLVGIFAFGAVAQDDHPAINNPDRFAWELFVDINKPFDPTNPNGPALWESWALASDVFRNPNSPPSWPNEPPRQRQYTELDERPLQQIILDLQQQGLSRQIPEAAQSQRLGFRVDPSVLQRHGNETRMNRATFDFVVSQELYFIEGQEQFFNNNTKVDFPTDAKEIKAQWRRLDDSSQYGQYHTAQVNNNGVSEVWGLTALHITTKDLPNWFWATFEHTDNLGREAVVASRDTFGLSETGGPSTDLVGLFEQNGLGLKWHNYVLRGTQVDFVDSQGRPTILTNSQIEQGFQSTSSCITCHARASIGPKPRQTFDLEDPQGPHDSSRLSVFLTSDPPVGHIGVPDASWYVDSSTEPSARRFTQLDFVWSLFRARRRNPFSQPTIEPIPVATVSNGELSSARQPEQCCGQQATVAVRSVVQDQTGPEQTSMNALEMAVAGRAMVAEKPIQPDDYRAMIKAATEFASSLAGENDAEFTRLATSSLTQAILARRGLNVRDAMMRSTMALESLAIRQPEMTTDGLVWETQQLNTNFRDLMEKSVKADSGLFPITGPPLTARIVGPGTQVVGDVLFRDCVAVGARVGGQDRFCCTGTLIAPRVVVTAGHCFFCLGAGASNAVVFVGGDINSTGQTYTGQAFRHPGYNQSGLRNDLTVIVLDTPVNDVIPRQIATTSQIDGCTFVRAVGFGNADFASAGGFGTKRMVDVPVASICCGEQGEPAKYGCDAQLELVAGFVGLGPDSCNGDSGGPIYVLIGNDARDENAWAVAGATSRATALATRPCGDGGIYARLDQYLGFIEQFPEQLGPAPIPRADEDAASQLDIIEHYPDEVLARLEARDRLLRQIDPQRAIFETMLLWPQGRTITVAFRGGSQTTHAAIEALANRWTQHCNITFSFRDDAGQYRTWSPSDSSYAADIRVSFEDDGYWSLLGTDSRNGFIVRPGQPSMSLEGMDDGNLSVNEQGTVIHEFGHALGFHHEHQSPEGGCDNEFRWDDEPGYVPTTDAFGQFVADSGGRRPGIYTVLGGPPNNWSRATIDFNLRQLSNSSAFKSTEYDRNSIMHYSFPDWMFIRGASSPCFTSRNNQLSALDVVGIATAYPVDDQRAIQATSRRKDIRSTFTHLGEIFWLPDE